MLGKRNRSKMGLHFASLYFACLIAFNYLIYFSFRSLLELVDWTALHTGADYVPHSWTIHIYSSRNGSDKCNDQGFEGQQSNFSHQDQCYRGKMCAGFKQNTQFKCIEKHMRHRGWRGKRKHIGIVKGRKW